MTFEVDKSTIAFLEHKLQSAPAEQIKSLIRQLTFNPIDPQQNLYLILYQGMIAYCNEKIVHQVSLQDIFRAILQRAFKTNQLLGVRLQSIFQDQPFRLSLKKIVQPHLYKQRIIQPEKTTKPILNLVEPKNSKANEDKIFETKISQVCSNLLDKPQCLCENAKQLKDKNDSSFRCVHCNRLFHTICMSKKAKSQCCPYCHLERLAPLKKTVKAVFIGLLKKTKRKHIADFLIPQIEANQRVQFRCLRLKDDSQQACLFPDIAQLSINGQRCHLFEPINRHSSLKYRKDQPFNLLKGDYYKSQENRLQISQLVPMNRDKDYRQQYQNHLIGLYVVQDIKMDDFINYTKNNSVLGFSESHSVLQDAFGLGKDDQITCQLVKIPLVCPLTTVKIEIPARGYYCTHFQCFDLQNYITLISQSQNPRWKCPLCNSMAFQFKIDSILMEIIKQTKNNQRIKEILFFKNGDYSGIIDEEPLPVQKNIRSLKIPERIKPIVPDPQPIEKPKPKKKPRAIFQIPEDANIISLDD